MYSFNAEAYEQYQQSYKSSNNFWRRASQVYESAYTRFLEWTLEHADPNKGPIKNSASAKNRRYANMLYDFFQSKGLIINISGTLADKQANYTYNIQQDSNTNYQLTDATALECNRTYTTRFEAETAAFKQAFIVLDQWLEDQEGFGIRL
ncbi:hypothetical protein QNI19_35565 [Cytophagaceae bacterium DM2B3-1]|uniref:Uncharacterized protein n=1 Tax=Xanthocytophaga flava TaxID=3048013 RepID=A0ABT7CX63_9BACT|nr:hypothetical protein [Xanthocytophaga flavus]MDJ1498308.1 hypothetical protein [Xanthocytophaga flavus]